MFLKGGLYVQLAGYYNTSLFLLWCYNPLGILIALAYFGTRQLKKIGKSKRTDQLCVIGKFSDRRLKNRQLLSPKQFQVDWFDEITRDVMKALWWNCQGIRGASTMKRLWQLCK